MKFNYEDLVILARAIAAEAKETLERKAAPYIERAQDGILIGRIAAEQLKFVAAVRLEQLKEKVDARLGTSFAGKGTLEDEDAQMQKEMADFLKALGQQNDVPAANDGTPSQEDQLAALFGKAASPEEAEAILKAIFGEDPAFKSQQVTPPEVRIVKPAANTQKAEKPATKKAPGTKKRQP